ncbi:MAG TPA: hypothetical protein DCE07_04815 [Peptococcaceae bacterium]|nr:hypothetical protein [Peptococcaceae bacterium]
MAWRRQLASDWRPALLAYFSGRENSWPIPPVGSHRQAIDVAELILSPDDEVGPFTRERVAGA